MTCRSTLSTNYGPGLEGFPPSAGDPHTPLLLLRKYLINVMMMIPNTDGPGMSSLAPQCGTIMVTILLEYSVVVEYSVLVEYSVVVEYRVWWWSTV